MNYYYRTLSLDQSVSKLLKDMGIHKPHEISEKRICFKLGIHLVYSNRRCYSIDEDDFKLINIDNRLPKPKQREAFFHELCHVLRHSGNQLNGQIPKPFINLQEYDAKRFTQYAAIPLHMIDSINLNSPTILLEASAIFQVSTETCKHRFDQLKRNQLYAMTH
ncbi:ImmA/IrrE family metallo-endopeptidase [Sporolactobacillus terrae]|uniref:ImmA/IrrE family metallo-endopeptidase n=1 Tax=Sporolactobacillus terrae TaxID=269673 RepID=UPI000491088B|nr:ImmA/IrrE family metallo-endopeptidase [Sporolactobacillus terrae]